MNEEKTRRKNSLYSLKKLPPLPCHFFRLLLLSLSDPSLSRARALASSCSSLLPRSRTAEELPLLQPLRQRPRQKQQQQQQQQKGRPRPPRPRPKRRRLATTRATASRRRCCCSTASEAAVEGGRARAAAVEGVWQQACRLRREEEVARLRFVRSSVGGGSFFSLFFSPSLSERFPLFSSSLSPLLPPRSSTPKL